MYLVLYKVGRLFLVAIAAFLTSGVHVPTPAAAATVREMQWTLDALRITDAHKITKGEGVVVAVIDSGVDATHPDLAGQVLPGKSFGFTPADDGRIDHAAVCHGTGMAGLIAGKGGGVNKMLGIAPGAKILPVSTNLNGAGEVISSAIKWAVDNGANVISLSEGIPAPPQQWRDQFIDATRYALEHNVVIVAAAGNVDEISPQIDDVVTPADIPGVVAVSSSKKDGSVHPTSHYGPEIVVNAPGEDLVTTVSTKRFSSGLAIAGQTSGATAVTAGAVALIRAKYPSLDAKNIVNRLITTAEDRGTPGRDSFYGYGGIRPYEALTTNVGTVDKWPFATVLDQKAASTPGTTVGATAKNDPKKVLLVAVVGLVFLGFIVAVGVAVLLAVTRRRVPTQTPQPSMPLQQRPESDWRPWLGVVAQAATNRPLDATQVTRMVNGIAQDTRRGGVPAYIWAIESALQHRGPLLLQTGHSEDELRRFLQDLLNALRWNQ